MTEQSISVVICTYNRAKYIEGSLTHLVNQNLAAKYFEILVVNNNCTDGTQAIVDDFISRYPQYDIRQVFESNQGLSFARNLGVKEAKYDLICFIDDDGYAKCDYLENIKTYFEQNPKLRGLGGKVIPVYESAEPDWYNPFLRMMVTSIDFGTRIKKSKGKQYPAGCSMIYKKEDILNVGGFNNDLKWRADDKYIFHQISSLSDEIYYHPKLVVKHHIDDKRLTDENFVRLSGLLGSEERLRILGKKKWAYPFKLLEFVFKYFASLLIAVYFTFLGEPKKGLYTIRFRWEALKKFVG